MKKLESLGKRLTKNEQKKITGGVFPPDEGGQCGTACADTTACTANGHAGHCHKPTSGTNAGKCFCVAVY